MNILMQKCPSLCPRLCQHPSTGSCCGPVRVPSRVPTLHDSAWGRLSPALLGHCSQLGWAEVQSSGEFLVVGPFPGSSQRQLQPLQALPEALPAPAAGHVPREMCWGGSPPPPASPPPPPPPSSWPPCPACSAAVPDSPEHCQEHFSKRFAQSCVPGAD